MLTSQMAREAAEAGDAVRRHITRSTDVFVALGTRLRASPPTSVVTCARGSSDHACTYGKILIETVLGLPVASVGPSLASVYGRPLRIPGGLFIAVSQSGRSPDLLCLTEAARAGSALTVGFVNDATSPLAMLCDVTIPLAAGEERSVAATKSCLAAMAAFLHLVAHWSGNASLLAHVIKLPLVLDAAREQDWYPALQRLRTSRDLYVVGRGPALGVAAEMALKCKEAARLHAEAFSAAELIHGPLELVRDGFPVVVLTQVDAAAEQNCFVLDRLLALGAQVFTTEAGVAGAILLPLAPDLPSVLAPLAALQSFYLAISRVAQDRGLDPDNPANLRKVTQTT